MRHNRSACLDTATNGLFYSNAVQCCHHFRFASRIVAVSISQYFCVIADIHLNINGVFREIRNNRAQAMINLALYFVEGQTVTIIQIGQRMWVTSSRGKSNHFIVQPAVSPKLCCLFITVTSSNRGARANRETGFICQLSHAGHHNRFQQNTVYSS